MTHNIINEGPKIALFEPDIPQNTAAIINRGSRQRHETHTSHHGSTVIQ